MAIKYYKFTKVRNKHSLLEFRSNNDKLKCEIFDAVASVEGAEIEIVDFISKQFPEINCTEIQKAEFDLTVKDDPKFIRLKKINTENWKTQRDEAVSKIVVTHKGIDYQGDERSQQRLSNNISAMLEADTRDWFDLANVPQTLTRDDLVQILKLATEAQSLIWVDGRP